MKDTRKDQQIWVSLSLSLCSHLVAGNFITLPVTAGFVVQRQTIVKKKKFLCFGLWNSPVQIYLPNETLINVVSLSNYDTRLNAISLCCVCIFIFDLTTSKHAGPTSGRLVAVNCKGVFERCKWNSSEAMFMFSTTRQFRKTFFQSEVVKLILLTCQSLTTALVWIQGQCVSVCFPV